MLITRTSPNPEGLRGHRRSTCACQRSRSCFISAEVARSSSTRASAAPARRSVSVTPLILQRPKRARVREGHEKERHADFCQALMRAKGLAEPAHLKGAVCLLAC